MEKMENEEAVSESDLEAFSSSEVTLGPSVLSIEKTEDEEAVSETDLEAFSSSEITLGPSVLSIEKTEDEEAVSETDLEAFSSSEVTLGPSVLSIEKTEDEEAVSETDLEVLTQELVFASSASEPESTIPVRMEDDKRDDDSGSSVTSVRLAAGSSNRMQCTAKREASCGNEIGTRILGHRCGFCKEMFAQLQDLKEHMHKDGSAASNAGSVERAVEVA
ncbi:uncharacterized protein LOC126469646 [Schistocerca serialis cubense]|uniref:uncharacterized protein LOC126469646 n=1 Tax=Schistocerca serialis cubense TaxID=2023355 RepID=UPI00214E8CB1|nr:uncharacterized protein LOC126469646 [Schistocerca serialis cubense]